MPFHKPLRFSEMPRIQKPDITFHYSAPPFAFRERTRLKLFLVFLFKKERRKLSHLSYIFCDDEYLLRLNRQFLGHDFYTDILTFDQGGHHGNIHGEIYISIPRIYENAETHGTSFRNELHRVIFHGALHLCGFKDKTQKNILAMRAKEDFYLNIYFNLFHVEQIGR